MPRRYNSWNKSREKYHRMVKITKEMLADGHTQKEIAKRFNTSRSAIYRVAAGLHPKWYIEEKQKNNDVF